MSVSQLSAGIMWKAFGGERQTTHSSQKEKKGAEAVVVDPWYRCSCMLSFTITQAAVAIICLLSGALLNTEHGVCIASDPIIRRRSSLAVDVCRSRVCVVFERNQLSVGDIYVNLQLVVCRFKPSVFPFPTIRIDLKNRSFSLWFPAQLQTFHENWPDYF